MGSSIHLSIFILTSSSSHWCRRTKPINASISNTHFCLPPALRGAELSVLLLISYPPWRNEKGHVLNWTHLVKTFLERWDLRHVLELPQAEVSQQRPSVSDNCCQPSGLSISPQWLLVWKKGQKADPWIGTSGGNLMKPEVLRQGAVRHFPASPFPSEKQQDSCSFFSSRTEMLLLVAAFLLHWSMC